VKTTRIPKRRTFLPLALYLLFVTCCFLSGCSVVQYFRPEGPPSDQELYDSYHRVKLKASSSYDVLTEISKPQYELLSQSKSVIASAGQKKKGYKTWFNMVAFDENKLTAKRKYIFVTDDRPNLMEEPRQDLSFDCEAVLDTNLLDKPYANENARRIAIIEQVRDNTGKDIDEVGTDNEILNTCGMMVKQAFEAALVKLEASPALAWKLTEPAGVEFSHINLNRGRIQLLLNEDIVKVKMRLGRQVKIWEKSLKQQDKKSPRESGLVLAYPK
jgi:hypothetical protein